MFAAFFRKHYWALMLAASALTLLRGFVVAWVLSPVAFGNYAVAIGLGAFAGLLVSLGSIEVSWKRFVISWAAGKLSETVHESRMLDRKMAFRVALPTILASGLAVSFGLTDTAFLIFAVGGFAWSAASVSAGASFLRASIDLGPLSTATFFRASMAFAAAILGAYLFSWTGAIIGEIIGSLCFLGYVEYRRKLTLRVLGGAKVRTEHHSFDQVSVPTQVGESAVAAASTSVDEHSGRLLFAANLLLAAPVFLDRFFVREIFGAEIAGTYGFLILFNMAALTFSGIVDQRVGPQVLRMDKAGKARTTVAIYAMKWVALVGFAVGLGGVIAASLVLGGPLSRFESEYALTPILLVAAISLASTAGYKHLSWVLIAWNEEIAVLQIAGGYVIVMVGILALTAFLETPLWGYIVACAIARFFVVAVMGGRIFVCLNNHS